MLYFSSVAEEPSEEVMGQWMKWFEDISESIVDSGEALMPGGSELTSKGVTTLKTEDWPPTGYTVIQAADMEAAQEIAKGCPALNTDTGVVRVLEKMELNA